MFTGVVREIGKVISREGSILRVNSSLTPKLGDSIAVNGVCLTVVGFWSGGFSVEVADETNTLIPSSKFVGDVHLESAMVMGDRFEGHIVQGHIDTIGRVASIESGEKGFSYSIEVDSSKIAYIVPKGSITIDGISLTVNSVKDSLFEITVIPHTFENTLFKTYKVGTLLNIETDLFARYIAHILLHRNAGHKRDNLSWSWREIDSINMSY